jgi:hypothetical protein
VLAYLDPGSGSLLVQAVVGGAAAVGVLAKLYWRRIRSAFRGDREREQPGEN